MDREMEEPLRQQSLSVSIEDASLQGNGSAGQNPASDLLKSESDRIKVFYQTVLSAIMVFIMAALSSYKDMKPNLYSTTSHNKAHLSNLLVSEGLFIFMTFLCAVILVMLDIFVYQHDRRGRVCYMVLSILVMVTGMMLIIGDMVLVIITNRNNMVLSVILAPVLGLFSLAIYTGAWMGEQRHSSTIASRYDAAMKSTFDVATVGTIASFGVQGIVVFRYLKSPGSNEAKPDPPLDIAVCYVTSTLSLIVMMICAMPLALLPEGMLEAVVRAAERLRHAVLAVLAMTALVVAVEFLDGLIILSFFPEAVAFVLCYAVHLFSACQPQVENSPLDFAFRIVVAAGFMLMTGLYGALLGTDHYSLYLKAAMVVLLFAILSSLSRLATPFHFHMPENGGPVQSGIVRVALALPALALVVAVPLVLMVLYNHYLIR